MNHWSNNSNWGIKMESTLTIKDIESIIRDIIKTNEKIVSVYDSQLLCSDYEDIINKLKELCTIKKDLIESLEKSMNVFFKLKQNPITKKLKINSFRLVPSLISLDYKFFLPKSVDQTSRQYYCYISMMERLTREYECISKVRNTYCLLDITATLNLDELLKNEKTYGK